MIAWINVAVLLVATLLTLFFYVKSAGPAALEKRIGSEAYARCTRYRFISGIMMGIACVNYVVYVFYPLPLPLPATFPWPWWASVLVAVAIALPSGVSSISREAVCDSVSLRVAAMLIRSFS